MNRCSKNGVLDRGFEKLQQEGTVRIRIKAFCLGPTSVTVHPDGTGALKNGPQTIDKLRALWNTKIQMVTADVRTAISFSLLVSNDHDAVQGELHLEDLGLST